MPRAKISEFSTIPGDNTDIDGINIAEGCAPSGINDAIRELMAQLKDFQSGAAGDNITVVGTLAAKGTSSSGADLKLYEDTDNGTNYVGFIAPASIASNVQWTLPSADGSSGQSLQTNGSGTLSFATLGISAGGTGQTTANAAFNALAPSQTSNAGRYLKTDGTNTSWDLLDISTADITGTLPVANGGTGITSFGTGVATALGINVGSAGAFVTNGGALGTPSSGTVTNLTGTASININGTVGATTPNTGSFTTLTTSSTVTHNGGTANGVAYLNGSKVLTTGSALTFDGTTLTIPQNITNTSASSSIGICGGNSFSPTNGGYLIAYGGSHLVSPGRLSLGTTGTGVMDFQIAGNEGMRLTSTGLGIGTSSPAEKLSVAGNITNTGVATFGTSGSNTYVSLNNNGYLRCDVANWFTLQAGSNGYQWRNSANSSTAQMTLDSSGNLGLGVTPSAWSAAFGPVLQVRAGSGGGAFTGSSTDNFRMFVNTYYDGSYKRIGAGYATQYEQASGYHAWYTAGSSTANSAISFSQALTLTAAGDLGVGVTSPSAKLHVAGTVIIDNADATNELTFSGTQFTNVLSGSSSGFQLGTTAAGYLAFLTNNSERARITSGGSFWVGGQASSYSNERVSIDYDGATQRGMVVRDTASQNSNPIAFVYGTSTLVGYIGITSSSTSYNTSSDYRLKDNQQPLTNSGAFIDALQPKTWNWKADGSKGVGFIAHEVQEVSPGTVVGEKDAVDADGKPVMQAMEYGSAEFIANIIAELQSLRARVAQLEAK